MLVTGDGQEGELKYKYEEANMFCSKCGKENDDSAKFCTSCGKPLYSEQSLNTKHVIDLPEEEKKYLTAFKVGKIKNPEKYGGFTKGGLVFRRIIAIFFWPLILIIGLVAFGSKSIVKKNQGKDIIIGSIFFAVLSIVAISLFSGEDSGDVEAINVEKPSLEDYENKGIMLDYRKARLEEYEKGEMLNFAGSVFQIVDDKYILLQMIDFETFQIGDNVLLLFDEKPKVLEEDLISIAGRYIGTKKYETVLVTEAEVPFIQVDYYELVKIE